MVAVHLPSGPCVGVLDADRATVTVSGVALHVGFRRREFHPWQARLPRGGRAEIMFLGDLSPVGRERALTSSHPRDVAASVHAQDTSRTACVGYGSASRRGPR